MTVEGIDEFREFGENLYDVDVQEAIKRGVEQTADDYIEEVVRLIRQESTAKGGTLNSETSPYSPGGENDSSDDSLHISDKSAWTTTASPPNKIVVKPRQEVKDRAWFLEKGTDPHEPDGDTPYYFQVNGLTIVVSDAPPDATLSERFDAEPQQVDGIEEQGFFRQAALNLQGAGASFQGNALENNIEHELRKEIQEAME